MICDNLYSLRKQHGFTQEEVADSMALWGKLIALKLNIPFVSSTTTFAFNQHSAKIMKQGLGDLAKVMFQMGKAKKHIKQLQAKGYPVKSVLDIIQNDNETHTIVYTSPEFQPCSETFSDKYVFVGPSIAAGEVAMSSTRQRQEKTVYISMGTVNNQMKDFYHNCIEALRDSNYHVIMSVGKEMDLVLFADCPDNIEIHNYVNQLKVLQNVDVFLTHCGMNSVSEGLYYQVPLIMYPQTNEQKGVAYRVNEFSAGVYLEKNSASAIREAVDKVLGNPIYKENAGKIAESFYKCRGSKAAVEKIMEVIGGERD